MIAVIFAGRAARQVTSARSLDAFSSSLQVTAKCAIFAIAWRLRLLDIAVPFIDGWTSPHGNEQRAARIGGVGARVPYHRTWFPDRKTAHEGIDCGDSFQLAAGIHTCLSRDKYPPAVVDSALTVR